MERQAVRACPAVGRAGALLLALALLAYGCGPKHIAPSDPQSLDAVNAKLGNQEATIFMRDGRESVVLDIRIGSDETSWLVPRGWERHSAPTEDVWRIIVQQPARGHIKKLLYVGAGVLAIMGEIPWYGAALFFVPPLWVIIGPPTMFNDRDVYEIELAQPESARSEDVSETAGPP